MKVLTAATACVIIATSFPAFSQSTGISQHDKDGRAPQNAGANNPTAEGSSTTSPTTANPGSASNKGSTAGSGTGAGSAGGGAEVPPVPALAVAPVGPGAEPEALADKLTH